MKVLALTRYGREGSSSRLRFLQFLPALEAAGFEVTTRPLWDARYLAGFYAGAPTAPTHVAARYARRALELARDVRGHDVAWIEAELFPWLPALAERALPIPYVVDYDDAVGHKYERRGAARALLGGKIAGVMRGAALVVAGNPYVASLARAAGASRVEVVATVVEATRYPTAPPPHTGELRVGWIGTPETARYLRLVEGALRTVAASIPMRLVLVGATSTFPGVPVEHRRWSEATEARDVATFDVGIMPLPDEPWERGKSAYKLIQCMACARPVIASPVGVNADVVGDAGLLASTEAEWVEALLSLARDAPLRAALGAKGRGRVEARYSLEVIAPTIVALLGAAAGRPRS